MNGMFLKAVVALLPTCVLLSGALILFFQARSKWSLLQLIGACSLVLVALVHVCEALGLFPWMNWGYEHSVGHYLDLFSAILGLTLFPLGYLLGALSAKKL